MILALVARKPLAVAATFNFSEKLGPSSIVIPSGFFKSPMVASRINPMRSFSTSDMSLSDRDTLAMESCSNLIGLPG